MKRNSHYQTSHKVHQLTGFSLVELLVAVAIAAILMMGLLSIMGGSSKNYKQTQQKVATIADTRALFQSLDLDLASRVAETPFLLQTNPENHHEFAFVRTIDALDIDTTGDLTTSVYYVAFTADDANSGSPKLYRRVLDSAETQKLIAAGKAATFPSYDPATDDPIAYNIVHFEVNAQKRDASRTLQPWNAAPGSSPDVIEIVIELVDDVTAKRFTQPAQWTELKQSTDPTQRAAVRRQVHRINLNP